MTSALARNHFSDVSCGTERSQSPATGHTSMHGRGFQLVPVLLYHVEAPTDSGQLSTSLHLIAEQFKHKCSLSGELQTITHVTTD